MHLVIFDIDGTITDSVNVDGECFIEAFESVHGLRLPSPDWKDFKHVTDSGITNELFSSHFGRKPNTEELSALKQQFINNLYQRRNEITEIPGARDTIRTLNQTPDCVTAFATGGWKESALLKLERIGLRPNNQVLATANDHFDRSEIIKLAIDKSLNLLDLNHFDSITYIGDGLWDMEVASQLGIEFIGLDYKSHNKLKTNGAQFVLKDLNELDQILNWINKKPSPKTN